MAATLSRWMPGLPSGFLSKSVSNTSKPVDSLAGMKMQPQEEDAEGDYEEDDQGAEASTQAGQKVDEGAYKTNGVMGRNGGKQYEAPGMASSEDETTRKSRKRKRTRSSRQAQKLKEEESDVASDAESASSRSSEVEAPWEADEEHADTVEGEDADPNRCVFCHLNEDQDPAEDFEEMLNCAACGDHAHRQCTRDSDSSYSDEQPDSWRCPDCVEKSVEPEDTRRSQSRRPSSAPRMIRALLPVSRKPGAHTIFESELFDEQHKTRNKRKASSASSGSGQEVARKRRRDTSEVIVLANRDHDERVTVEPRLETPRPSSSHVDHTPQSRSTRTRQRQSDKPLVKTLMHNEDRFVLSFRLSGAKLMRAQEDARKARRRDRDRARREKKASEQAPPPKIQEVSHYPALQSTSFMNAFFEMHERETDPSKIKPYGGILSEAEADTTRTFPQILDRKKFESARLRAEEEWKKKLEAAAAEQARTSQKAAHAPGRIKCIHFGGFEIDTLHASPYPEEYSRNRVLQVCEFCLKYMNSDFVAWRHKLKCPARHPPGDEIYHDGTFSFWEVDGRKNPVYCQNLCLLAKLFLGSKTLYYDVEPFLFYVMTENNSEGCHFVGYFSKEKRPSSLNNVSCILVLPIHQRRGFGHMLIDFSYLLTRVEEKTGSPEKPLSDMGLVSYRSYWRRLLCARLLNETQPLSITEISNETGMTPDDIVCTLEGLRALVRDPLTRKYALRLDYSFYKQYVDGYEKRGYPKVDPDALMWVPYVMGRDGSHYENAPIQTVAQRGDDPSAPPPEEGIQLAENDVAAKDFATDLSKMPSTASRTPDEDSQNQFDSSITPFPDLSAAKTPRASKPAPLTPSTAEEDFEDDAQIPATRFEVFPPLPGSQRKKAGRPFARGSARRNTPLRRGLSQAITPMNLAQPATARRTRSALAEMVNGDPLANVDADAEGDAERHEDVDAEGDAEGDAEEPVEGAEEAVKKPTSRGRSSQSDDEYEDKEDEPPDAEDDEVAEEDEDDDDG